LRLEVFSEVLNYSNVRKAFAFVSNHKTKQDDVYFVENLDNSYLYYNQIFHYNWKPIADNRTEKHPNEQDYRQAIDVQVGQVLARSGRCFFLFTKSNKARFLTILPPSPPCCLTKKKLLFCKVFATVELSKLLL